MWEVFLFFHERPFFHSSGAHGYISTMSNMKVTDGSHDPHSVYYYKMACLYHKLF